MPAVSEGFRSHPSELCVCVCVSIRGGSEGGERTERKTLRVVIKGKLAVAACRRESEPWRPGTQRGVGEFRRF